jgi:hypothetical protein
MGEWMYRSTYIYIYEVIVYIKANLNDFTTNSGIYSHNTRRTDDLFIVPCIMSLCKNNFNNTGLCMLNQLPQYITEILVLHKFTNSLKTYLLNHCFYSVDEFLFLGTNTNPNLLYHIIYD